MSSERALFDIFARAANGCSRDAVVGAAANVIVNALRQAHRQQGEAHEELDALAANIRQNLARHYDDHGQRKERSLLLPPLAALVDLVP